MANKVYVEYGIADLKDILSNILIKYIGEKQYENQNI